MQRILCSSASQQFGVASTWLIISPDLTLHSSPTSQDTLLLINCRENYPLLCPFTTHPLQHRFHYFTVSNLISKTLDSLAPKAFICPHIASASSQWPSLHFSSHALFHDFVYVVSFCSNTLTFLPNGELPPILQNSSTFIYGTFPKSSKRS